MPSRPHRSADQGHNWTSLRAAATASPTSGSQPARSGMGGTGANCCHTNHPDPKTTTTPMSVPHNQRRRAVVGADLAAVRVDDFMRGPYGVALLFPLAPAKLDESIHRAAGERLFQAVGPEDLKAVDFFRLAQPEMDAG